MIRVRRSRSAMLLASIAVTMIACATEPASPDQARIIEPLPEHPDELQFSHPDLEFPEPLGYRHELVTGDIAFIVPDHRLPLVKIALYAPAGDFLLEPAQAGLAGMTAAMLRDGGTTDLSPSVVDERLDFLATGMSFSIGSVSASAALDTLSANLEESLGLMFDLLADSAWDAERLALRKQRTIESMRRRNDDTRRIEPRVWADLMRGEDFFTNDRATQSTIEAISAEDMAWLRDRVYARGHLVIAVSGAVDVETIKGLLERHLLRLPQAASLPPIPDDPDAAPPGLYGVDKEEVSQSRVTLGHPGLMRGHPDEYAVAVMNEILGGGGFTSRIVSRVRSDEGLAYSAGSRYSLGRHFPGQFRAWFQSRNAVVAEALEIVLEELARIRLEPVSSGELATAKESQLAFLADLFSSAARMATRFAVDALDGRDADYWREYEARIRAVTAAEVQRVANEHLQLEDLRILVVGKLAEAGPGLAKVAGHPLQRIPLKHPLTQNPMETEQ